MILAMDRCDNKVVIGLTGKVMDPDIVASPVFVEASAYGKRQRELQRKFLLNDRSFYQPANGFVEILQKCLQKTVLVTGSEMDEEVSLFC